MPLAALTGNERPRALLLAALGRGMLPHALLFHGPRGVGKARTALALAEALLCPNASPDACGSCSSCRRVGRRLHPDVIWLEREADAQFIKIEAAREVVRECRLKPYDGRAKVVLVPDGETLSEDSSNTLLKTLEEPPPATYLVIVTSARAAVLPTVRSRCQQLAFRALARTELERQLVAGSGIDPAEAARRARRAEGSETRALELDLPALDALAERALSLLCPLAAGRLGPAEVEAVLALAEELARKDDGADAFLFETLRPLARDALVLAGGGGRELLVAPEHGEALDALARSLGVGGAAELLADLARAEAALRINANRRLLVEAVLLGVALRAAQPRPARS